MAGGTGSSHYQQRKTGRSRRGNALLYISLSHVAFGRVRPGGRTLFFLLCFIVFHTKHPVSDTNMGLDQMRRIRVSFQFFAQGCHINTQGSNVIFLRTSPYLLCDGCMRQHFAHIMRQHTQQFVLDGVRCTSFSPSQTHPAEKSIFKGPLTKNWTVYAVRSQQIQSALRYTQSCQQLVHGKTALSDNRLRRCPVLRSYQNLRSGHSGQ